MTLKTLLCLPGLLALAPLSAAVLPNPGDSINPDYVNWYNLSPEEDKILGASVDRAYRELLAARPAKKKMVVAVIDGGVDIYHEDLAEKIWTNPGEIADNGIDDDGNGYVDDIHGWNFLGNSKGENIKYANYEFVRIIRQYEPLFEDVEDASEVADSLKQEYAIYQACLSDYQEKYDVYNKQWKQLQEFKQMFDAHEEVLQEQLGEKKITKKDLSKVVANSERVSRAVSFFRFIYTEGFSYKKFNAWYSNVSTAMEKHLNKNFDPREIIGDDLTSLEHNYGNNEVKGPRATHGTMVAGVIAASRGNEIGIDGIADAAEIMVLRTVPDGDEYDKDVALSIMYAVDNGADVINMSFGKKYSPQKNLVDQALQYAADKNVLLVHAAGNDSEDNDEVVHFPASHYGPADTIPNWLVVGANDRKKGKRMVARFSNYGDQSVDLMAPGVNIVTTYPENHYRVTQGTSFSAPVVSGVAALVWSRYPELSALELKEVLMKSVYTKYYKRKVYRPFENKDDREKVRFYELSQTGGVVSAYQALQLAEARVAEKSEQALDSEGNIPNDK